MVEGFEIVVDRERVPIELLLTADPLLSQVVRYINQSIAFAGVLRGKTVAACLMMERAGYFDIVNLAVEAEWQRKGLATEMLRYVMDYARAHGGRYVEIGASNAMLHLYAMYQKLGFRVVGVWKDYYLSEENAATDQGAIHNRDMVRFRVDLQELRR